MTCTCKQCGEIIDVPASALPPELVIQPNREKIEFNLLANMFAFHMQQRHQQIVHTLETQIMRSYAVNLYMKFATSSNPVFEEEREANRALAYWLLLGDFKVDEHNLASVTGKKGLIL